MNRDSLTIYQAGKRSHATVRRLTHEVLVWEELRSTGPFFPFFLLLKNQRKEFKRHVDFVEKNTLARK